jgi:hypothetical protein
MRSAEEPPGANSRPALIRAGLGWLAMLAPLFFLSYGLSNRLAAGRTDIPSIVFDWEHHVPFIPWTIVPYWSIDLLYVIALFVCGTREELRRLAQRLILAQLIAVTCFIVVPLRYSFVRPATDGVTGWLFQLLSGFDLPYNQAPSLHIALLVILWVHFNPHMSARLRPLLHGWCLLIGISVLTTFQHHFIDVPTGLWLGWFCVWLLPDTAASERFNTTIARDPRRRQLAARYAIGGALFAGIASTFGGGWLWLLWPAASLVLVAIIYLFRDAAAFGKTDTGVIAPATRWLLWPYLLGIWINARIRTLGKRRALRITDSLWLSALPSTAERRRYPRHTVIDLTADLSGHALGPRYRNVPLLDLVAPRLEQLQVGIAAISEAMTRGPVMVCCALGLSRSATVAAAWLIARENASLDEAIRRIRSVQPEAVFTDAHVDTLRQLDREQQAPQS